MRGMTMIDHIILRVRDYKTSRDFYDAVLATLGYQRLMEFEGTQAGYGADGKPYFWIGEDANPHPRTHIAFAAADRAAVDAFHQTALNFGAKSDGAPGVRENYHPSYYAAFVFDPDGHNIEAVCHTPEGAVKGAAGKAKAVAKKATKAAAKAAPRATAAAQKLAGKAKATAKKAAGKAKAVAKKPARRR